MILMVWCAAALLILFAWSALAILLYVGFRAEGFIERLPTGDSDDLPALAVIVPALNEQGTIDAAMRTLLAVDYPSMRVIAIDDRSTDSTGAVLDALAAESSRLEVIHVTDLPPGWLGKNHALHTGAARVAEPWILFTDADVHFAPNSLRRAVRYTISRKLDHLALFPNVVLRGFWETLFVSFFGVIFSARFRPWAVENPKSSAYVGVGAFNLVRSESYRKMGGHAALPMEVADDVKLGKLMKQSGGRSGVLASREMVRVRWISGLKGAINGLSKNMFAGLGFDPWKVAASCATLLALTWGPPIGLLASPTECRPVFIAAWLMMASAAAMPGLTSGASRMVGFAFPAAGILIIYTMLRSMWLTYRQGGVIWRGTHYALDELRRGVV